MDYFAGLDISMDETHVCVLDREGVVVYESKSESTAAAIAVELSRAPSCRRIVFETGRMAPILFHGLSQLGLPVVCVESRQAYQALKSLAAHKTDRNDARGLAHLARTENRWIGSEARFLSVRNRRTRPVDLKYRALERA